MLFRMLFQSWKHGLKRKLLAIITIFLASGLVSALLAVSIDIGDKMAKELKSYGANILIEPASSAVLPEVGNANTSLATQDFIDEKELPNIKDIFWRNNIVGFAPLLSAEVQIEGGQKVGILGTFFDHNIAIPDEDDYHTGQKIISPYWHVEGEWVDDAQNHFTTQVPALIGKQLAQTLNRKIGDRFDLTLECIARWYQGKDSPLADVFDRYGDFFEWFGNFRGYVDFFLLQDFVDDEYQAKILTDFDDFQSSPLPQTVEQYTAYLQGLTEVLTLRAKRIERYIN